MDFRPETLSQFILTTKPVWFLKSIWFGALGFLFILFIFTFKNNFGAFCAYFAFSLIILPVQALFFYSLQFRMYNEGRKAFLELGIAGKNDVLCDIPVYVRDFDLGSRKVTYSIDISKVLYDFDEADVILGASSLVLLGKGRHFGSTTYASPVEITTANKFTSITAAILLQWSKERGRIIIKIEDEFYKQPIKIEFKGSIEQLSSWLELICLDKLVQFIR